MENVTKSFLLLWLWESANRAASVFSTAFDPVTFV
jgi:hypothetical protein